MTRIQWARASQFNWVFDNMGGTPLQEAVAGAWQNAVSTVAADGRVTIAAPLPGGGQVYYVRGVWPVNTTFPWSGFWAEPMAGDLINYYLGGSFENDGERTTITLGTALPPGTEVQLYYIYLTGEQAAKYEPLNDYPCIRRAYRGREDYTYDFAVDRMLDLMACLHLAGQEQDRDYTPLIRFLWSAFVSREESRTTPLMHDAFDRQLWDRGAHLMYRGATNGSQAFQVFGSELAPGLARRALQVRVDLPATTDAAWFGYGLDWSLELSPFSTMDCLTCTLKGQGETRRLHNLTKIGSGSATLVLQGDYARAEKRRFVVQADTTGAVGMATFRWSRDDGLTWEASGLVSGDRQHPVALADGVEVYWEGAAGTHLVAGDYWTFWGGEPAVHPRRLLATLNDAAPDAADPWTPQHNYVHAIPDRFSDWTAFELPFTQFWRRDNIIEDGDRVQAMWGAWYAASQPDESDLTIGTREETEVLLGDTFYTQRRITWDLSPYATAFGVWAGIDSSRCNSTGHLNVNFLLKPVVRDVGSLTLRLKVKDAQGSYFYRDETVAANAWQRVTVPLAEMLLESGSLPLTHPLAAVDIGIPTAPPSNGEFFLTDLKFDDHLTFAGAGRLRLLEFKMEQQGLPTHEWWLQEVALNLEAQDPYPYAPRLAISLTPYGQNPWRGPTLVHYAHPLGPHLVGAVELTETYVRLHREAQEEFHRRYGGVQGPIVPVHTRNDVENIALCGEEDFARFSWWPRYRNFGKVTGFWHFNEALTDASGKGHTLTWQGDGNPVYDQGICQPGNTSVHLDGSHYLSLANHNDFNPGGQPFTVELVLEPEAVQQDNTVILGKGSGSGANAGYWVYLNATGQIAAQVLEDYGQNKFRQGAGSTILTNNTRYYIVVTWDPDGDLKIFINGAPEAMTYVGAAGPWNPDNTEPLGIGSHPNWDSPTHGKIDLVGFHNGRALAAQEIADNWQIIQGQLNGSAYPEVGNGLGQYWAFMRLAEYYFVSGDAGAWTVLDNWLEWLNTYGLEDES